MRRTLWLFLMAAMFCFTIISVQFYIIQPSFLLRINYTCTESARYQDCPSGYYRTIPEEDGHIVWVRARGDYLTRLAVYNQQLAKLRTSVVNKTSIGSDGRPSLTILHQCGRRRGFTYLSQTSRNPSVTTVALALDRSHADGQIWHSDQDTANLLIQEYHPWTASEPLCSWLTSNTTDIKHYAWGAMFRKQCVTDLNVGLGSTKLEPMYLNARRTGGPQSGIWPKTLGGFLKPEYYFTLVNYVHYIQVVEHGMVDIIGDVYTRDMKLVQFSCSCAAPASVLVNRKPFKESLFTLFEEVFVISQKYNHVLYHSTIEDLPRAIPYLEFLLNNPRIKIHVSSKRNKVWLAMFDLLGIKGDRFTWGMIRAKVVYLPQFTPCGLNQVQALQLTRELLHRKLDQLYPRDPRKTILLIKRSGGRRFLHHDAIVKGLSAIANNSDLAVEVLHDKHLPSMHGIFRMFRRAVVVVGPHGAGLLNLVFSHPGTLVVEGVCHGGSMVLYYLWEAHTLGQHWHGIPGLTDNCGKYIDSPTEEIIRVVTHFVQNKKGISPS